MTIRTERTKREAIEVKWLTVYIGEDTYRLFETIDGRLEVIKTTNSIDQSLRVHPRSGNEIEISQLKTGNYESMGKFSKRETGKL